MASQSSRSSRFRSPAKELLYGHGERPTLRTSSTKDNPGRRFWDCVQDGCNFFCWADPEPRGAQQDTKIAKTRRKITSLKARLKNVEWKLRIVAALGIVRWIRFLFLLLQNPYKLRQSYGMHLNLR
ncbi:hypothetical protein Ahy_B01g056297 isoform B [Arachis hypogaea]|uniref:GRF-type domain-containing protein n=1 Tax=Arachis hypogaea TaxID=3818 RepID=A0A445AYL4_ARAHY|nr:hypothetical protein Ahy_B01g056297 isoform B [Arachis hypogaea]